MTRRHELNATRYRVTFNLFRGRLRRDLLCAVPQDEPVPGFLDGDAWEFAGTLSRPAALLPAQARSSGFYLFESDPGASDAIMVASAGRQAGPVEIVVRPDGVAAGALPWMRRAAPADAAAEA
jgi:hypothetical protein